MSINGLQFFEMEGPVSPNFPMIQAEREKLSNISPASHKHFDHLSENDSRFSAKNKPHAEAEDCDMR